LKIFRARLTIKKLCWWRTKWNKHRDFCFDFSGFMGAHSLAKRTQRISVSGFNVSLALQWAETRYHWLWSETPLNC
jgi:hypothetical protein